MDEDKKEQNVKAAQIAQNKLLRILDGSNLKDRRHISDMLIKQEMLSVNQTAAQIKLTEAWKASKEEDYPVKMRREREIPEVETRHLRSSSTVVMMEGGKNNIARASFTRDAGRLWNKAPNDIKEAKTLHMAKKLIKDYCKTLPV